MLVINVLSIRDSNIKLFYFRDKHSLSVVFISSMRQLQQTVPGPHSSSFLHLAHHAHQAPTLPSKEKQFL